MNALSEEETPKPKWKNVLPQNMITAGGRGKKKVSTEEPMQIHFAGLFHRAILVSGSAHSSWALVDDPVRYAVRLASHVNCSIPRWEGPTWYCFTLFH